MRTHTVIRAATTVAITAFVSGFKAPTPARSTEPPETVMVTYHAKAGAADELARVITDHWNTAKRLGLVSPEPHLLVQSAESGRPVDFVEIFTWRDASIPDHAPEPIRAAWDKMNKLVEPRGGRPGIDFVEVKAVP